MTDLSRNKSIVNIPYSKGNDKEQDEKLLQPYIYILQVPGKNIRTKLAKAFNYWMKVPDEKMSIIEDIVQIMHNASLLIDDIQDNSILRRGIPVAHSIYGVASTLNSANYALFIALEKLIELDHPEAVKIYTEQVLELHRGQGMEIFWRDTFTCPTEKEYIQMTIRKTGGLFMLAIRLMQLFSEDKSNFTRLTELLGLFYQVCDDYLNLYSPDYTKNKTYCEDLTEGKFSFLIVHAITQSHTADNQVMHILRQRTKDIEVKKYCVSLLEQYGSFDYTRNYLAQLHKEGKDEVEKLGGNPLMDDILNSFLSICQSTSKQEI